MLFILTAVTAPTDQISGLCDNTRVDWEAFEYYSSLSKLKVFVEQHYAEPITLAKAAQIAGLERTYFSRFFHEKTGQCFRDWLAWMRTTHAVEMLASSDISITEVAFAVGFKDLRTFERACEKCMGCSPSQVKKKIGRAGKLTATDCAYIPNT